MAKNITIMGASYPDVPSVVLPQTGGGTAEFYDGCSVSYSLTDGATANVTPDKVVTGEGLSLRLSVPAGYVLSGVSVTMGGVDITSQVFAYDEDSGGGGSPTLQSKSVSYTPTTSVQSATVTADSGYDGLDSVAVSVGAIPSEYIIPSGTLSITENGTKDVTNYASVSVDVPTGGATVKTGTYTPAANYTDTGNRLIVSLADIGFTPTKFTLAINNYSDITATQYVVIFALYDPLNGTNLRITGRTSNTSGGVGASINKSALTTQTNGYLYNNGTNIYFRTTSAYKLLAAASYTWTAYK